MLERKDFGSHIGLIVEWVENYFQNLESLPIKSSVKPKDIIQQLPISPPETSEEIEDIISDLNKIILPGITHWQHPNFHAYFPANSSVESVYAEFITAAIGAQCMIWETSPAAAELEERMMDWFKEMMSIPEHMDGVIQDTASTATLAALIVAREKITDYQSNWNGVPPGLRVYSSKEIHSSIDKAVAICGIGRNNLVKIDTREDGTMHTEHLRKRILEDIREGYTPTCIISGVGTTGRLAVDDIKSISSIASEYKVWHHIDAAYLGTAAILPEYRSLLEGIETADSMVFNPHKWMFTNFDCTVLFMRDKEELIRTFEILPEYLKTSTRGEVHDYRDWGIPLGRRFRALKLWFVIRSYGVEGIRTKLRNHIALSAYFVEALHKNDQLEIVGIPKFNFCCFRLAPEEGENQEDTNKKNIRFLKTINETGKVFLSHTKINEDYVIRVVIGQTYVEQEHIDNLLEVIHNSI